MRGREQLTQNMGGLGRKLEAIWGVVSTGLSACLYLLDLGTSVSTVVTYYFYQYQCPQAARPPPSLLRHDPICRVIRSRPGLYTISAAFWSCVATLVAAHFIYAFMFWNFIPAHQHPFRLAYFMPLIHLYRLLQLLRQGFDLKTFEELQKEQTEVNSLYNALGVALETFPQFVIQALVAVRLGDNLSNGSADVSVQAQHIPTTLVLSLVASLMSGFFNSGKAGSLLMAAHVSCLRRACVALLVGCQTIALMVSKTMNIIALSLFFNGVSLPLYIYVSIEFIATWTVVGFYHKNSYQGHHDKNACFKFIQSFVYTIFLRDMSPIYVNMRERESFCLLILDVLMNVILDLMGTTFVLVLTSHLRDRESPCHSLNITPTNGNWNEYVTCNVFLGSIFISLLVVIFTTLIYICLKQYESDANNTQETFASTNVEL